jgi:uncharacterized protein (DUF779 family)
VTATPVAIEMVERLSANDILIVAIGDAPFYVDHDQYERWGRPSFLIDAGSGPAEGFSLSLPDAHFITRTPAAPEG